MLNLLLIILAIVSPIISYTVHGKKYEIVGTSYSTNIKIGQNVAILFDEDDPSKAIIKKGCILCLLLPES